MGAIASLPQGILPVDPGGQASIELTVRNNGTVVDQFAIEILGDVGGWAAADPPTVSLFPGAEGTTQITFRPPRTSASRAGTVPFGVMVRSSEDPDGSTVAEGTLDVAPFLAPSAELIPRTSHGSGVGRHELALDNRGNLPLTAALEGIDPDRLVSFTFDPPSLSVDPGVAGFARMLVKPAKRFWRGPAKTRAFQVAIRPDAAGAEPVVVGGTFLQTSVLPWWFVRALIALIALLIAAILLWVFVLQPAIKSTAADTLVEFGFSPRPGSSAAGGGGEPGASASPLPSGALTPSGGGTTQVDGRLDTANNALTLAGGTLFITDLVFSNPTGASGDLTLQRTSATGTTPLFVLRLDNFRDLDFHFVTPLAIHAGDTLALVAGCVECSPAVFYSGYLQGP